MRHAVDVGDPATGPVPPLELDVHLLEAVGEQLGPVPGLSHDGRLEEQLEFVDTAALDEALRRAVMLASGE